MFDINSSSIDYICLTSNSLVIFCWCTNRTKKILIPICFFLFFSFMKENTNYQGLGFIKIQRIGLLSFECHISSKALLIIFHLRQIFNSLHWTDPKLRWKMSHFQIPGLDCTLGPKVTATASAKTFPPYLGSHSNSDSISQNIHSLPWVP